MEIENWIERWHQGQIGFHQTEINPYLIEHWQDLAIPTSTPVFVPLCGKSLDMIWLRQQGHPVIGVEVSAKAVAEFFQENQLEAVKTRYGSLELWQQGELGVYLGDFFDVTVEQLGQPLCVYDRAALVALPQDLRRRYVKHLSQLLPVSSKVLLITMDYPQEKMPGPPFSVDEAEVQALFRDEFIIEHKQHNDVLKGHRFKERGIEYLFEDVYVLEKQ